LHGLSSLLQLERRLDEGDGKAGLQMPFDVACEESRWVSTCMWREREAWIVTME